jgi:hypothetical protein
MTAGAESRYSPTVVFADSKHGQSNLIGMFDLFNQVAQAVRQVDSKAGVVVRRREAIDANLHLRSRPTP